MTSFLCAKNVSYRFPGSGGGIGNVTLEIGSAQKTVIMGANGSGKTTLFLLLNGSLRAHAGCLTLGGELVSYSRSFSRRWRSSVGLVLQDPSAHLVGGTVAEDVELGPQNLGLSKLERSKRVEQALGAMGISELQAASVHELSFGQKKRVAIAGILAMKPKVLLLDEPMAGLDAQGVVELTRTLNALHADGISVVLSTHDSEFTLSWADCAVILESGNVLASGNPVSVFSFLKEKGFTGVGHPALLEAWTALPAHLRKTEKPSWESVLAALHG